MTQRRSYNYENEERRTRTEYNYGNTVRKLEPERREREPERRERRRTDRQTPERKNAQQVSRNTNKNRQRMEVVDRGYVIGITVIAAILMIAFVSYLRLETSIASRSSNITTLQLEISELKAENDAALGSIEDSVDLNTIKERATELGMVYISSGQVVEYQSPTADYVIQYEDIPSSGILPQSDYISE